MLGKRYVLLVLWLLVSVVGCAEEEGGADEVVAEDTSTPSATFALSAARSTATEVAARVVSPTPRATSVVATRTPRPTSVVATRTPRPTSVVATRTPRPTVVAHSAGLLAAQEAVRIGDWEGAYGLYEALLAEADADEREVALFYMGDLYWRDNEAQLALETWQTALNEAPDGRFAPYMRYRLAREMAEEGQHEQAISWLEQVDAANDEADAMVVQRLIASYQALDEMEQVMVLHERLYDLSTSSQDMKAASAKALADWYKEEGQAQEALQWYEYTLEATEIESYRAQLLLMMAEMAMELDDGAYAREQWRRVVEEYPSRWAALIAATQLAEHGQALSEEQMGELYLANEGWNQAQDAFLTVLEEEHHDAAVHQKRAYALEGQERLSGALEEWLKVTTTHPEAEDLHDDALLEMGRLHMLLGNDTQAKALWQQVAEEYADGDAAPRALLAYAEWLREQGATAQEIASVFDELATSYPAHEQAPDALWQAGRLWFEAGDFPQAVSTFEQLAEYDEYAAEGWLWAGKSAAQGGNERQAQRFWQQAIATNESYYEALRAIELAEEAVFEARVVEPIQRPEADLVLTWLREAADLPDEADLYQVPDEALLAQGKALLLMDEQQVAMESFRTAIRAHREDAQALWAIAHDLHTHHVDRYSIFAAHLLMDLLGYTPLTAPPALAQLAYPIPFEAQLYDAATEWQYDPLLFAALIFQESRWDASAHSYAAARGLTQIIPATADWLAQRLEDEQYSYHELDRPLMALQYGGYYFDYLLKRFEQNPYHALAAYHSGPGNAQKWLDEDPDLFIEQITIRQTRTYVKAVYEHWHAYQHIYGE